MANCDNIGERRHDYVDLVKVGAENSNDIKHMKKTLDEHTKDIKELGKNQIEMMTITKDVHQGFKEFTKAYKEDKQKLDKLDLKMTWTLRGIYLFIIALGGTVGGFFAMFKTKIIAALSALL